MREEEEVATEAVLADRAFEVKPISTTENIVFYFTYSCNMPASVTNTPLSTGVSKPVQSSEDDIDEDDGKGDDVKYRKGSDAVAQDDEAKEPEIPRQKVT
jgi:hypothetical protein